MKRPLERCSAVVLALLGCAAAFGQDGPCGLRKLTHKDREFLSKAAAAHIQVPFGLSLREADVERLASACVYRLRFRAIQTPSAVFEFLASADLAYLGREMFSLRADPVEAHRELRRRALTELSDSVHPRTSGGSPEPEMVVFSDFACPRSRELWEWLQKRPGKKIGMTFRFQPLRTALSWETARVGACALLQGENAFWAAHNALFAAQEQIISGHTTAQGVVSRLSEVDGSKLDQCIRSNAADEIIRRDMISAVRLGLSGTPTIFVKGVQIDGVLPQRIEMELAHSDSDVKTEVSSSVTQMERKAIDATTALLDMVREGASYDQLALRFGRHINWTPLLDLRPIIEQRLLGTEIAPLRSRSQVQIRMFLRSQDSAWKQVLRWELKREAPQLLSMDLEAMQDR